MRGMTTLSKKAARRVVRHGGVKSPQIREDDEVSGRLGERDFERELCRGREDSVPVSGGFLERRERDVAYTGSRS